MSPPRNTEGLANYELAQALKRRNPGWTDQTVHAERVNVIRQSGPSGGASKRPDILVAPSHCQPVIVETEFAPARTVEQDATTRLGTRTRSTGAAIEGVLSVVLPDELRTGNLAQVAGAEFDYAAHYLDSAGEHARWPEDGWINGGVDEIADAIEYLSLSERQLARGTEALEEVVRHAADLLAEHAGAGALAAIAAKLHQAEGRQTERMAAAICVSAVMFHTAIEGQTGIPPVPLAGGIDKGGLLDTWNAILEINYWPIFSIARDVVTHLPLRAVPPVMDRIARSISGLSQLGATTYHDLTGRMFQTLITDRKFLATFYTLPASACLLAEMAVERLGVDWSDREAVEKLRIADFACGTGALLSAAQRAVYRRYRRAGGDDRELHRAAMEKMLMGLDIMPAATHLTCSMLSSAHPSLSYGMSQIHTMPYGTEQHKDAEGKIFKGKTHIGALNLLVSGKSQALFSTGSSLGSTEAEGVEEHNVMVGKDSCDLVIMNPPFTRPTNHEAGHADIPVPSFAGFGTSHEEQQKMAAKLKKWTGPFGSGHAGLASNFMDLAHSKLKDGGVLALVLPFSFVQGRAWARAWKALDADYSLIQVTAIAAVGSTARAFSADTGMAECLLVATKKGSGNSPPMYSNLLARPESLLQATVEAKGVESVAVPNRGAAGVMSASVAKAAHGLTVGQLCLPRQAVPVELPITPLGNVADRGLVHRSIGGSSPLSGGAAQGPFVVRPIRPGEVPDYPMLWSHRADRERSFIVEPDCCGEVRPKHEAAAVNCWDRTASCLHSSLDFRLNSQSLAMCLTPERCIGGRAWPNVTPHASEHEIPLLLWANSTLGVIQFWWCGTRQQQGRACITISKLPDLPVLDPRVLTGHQLDHCRAIFDEFKERTFLPANEAYRDEARKELDRELLFGITSVLQLDPALEEGLDLLRRQWCAEPSVHGGKGTRIRA